MITKALIISKHPTEDNKYVVRIPVFEGQGNNSDDPSLYPTYTAKLCYSPGTLDAFNSGDVVFVTFENNDYDDVIILGKLYKGEESEATSHQNINTLNVSGSANINGNVRINGVDINDVNLNKRAVNNVTDIVEDLQRKVKSITLSDFVEGEVYEELDSEGEHTNYVIRTHKGNWTTELSNSGQTLSFVKTWEEGE